ncbi:MAG: AbrB/MazE/SpoVT family DNA-binding domain-containing protein [Chlorobi bacterium]|nr:AbrB/MazE/SpoVT family DNA-binding domain-containing protein [Chlorobiota bacterium]
MEIQVVKIGNSKGIRLSKTLLERYNIKDKLEIIFEKGYLILKPVSKPRLGWEEAFKEMHDNLEDQLLFDDIFPEENPEEWK